MAKTIYKINEINYKCVFIDSEVEVQNKNLIVSKYYYNLKKKLNTFYIQSEMLELHDKVIDNSIIVISDDKIKNVMDNLDKLSLNYITKNNLKTKYNLQGYRYKTIVSESESLKSNIIKVLPNTNTLFFTNLKKNISQDECFQKINRGKIDKIKIIFQIDGLIIDNDKKSIFTNIIPSQILINEIIPEKIELVEYSFIDSDCDEKEEQKIIEKKVEKKEEKTETEDKIKLETDINSSETTIKNNIKYQILSVRSSSSDENELFDQNYDEYEDENEDSDTIDTNMISTSMN